MIDKTTIENAEDAIGFFSEEDILFHMTMGMDSDKIEDFEKRYNETIANLRKLVEANKKEHTTPVTINEIIENYPPDGDQAIEYEANGIEEKTSFILCSNKENEYFLIHPITKKKHFTLADLRNDAIRNVNISLEFSINTDEASEKEYRDAN